MLKIDLSRDARRFIEKLPPKQARQIAEKLSALMKDPQSVPSVELKGYFPFRRAKSGEFRIIFYIEADVVKVPLIGKRNDDEIYRLVERFKG